MKSTNADDIPIAPDLPVLVNGQYIWPTPRRIGNVAYPAGARMYSEGDCWTCPKCGLGNSTIAPHCVNCRALLPLGKTHPEEAA